MTGNKIKYNNGSSHDITTVSSNVWYRMKLAFVCKIGSTGYYTFSLYVNGELEVSDAEFYSDENSVNKLQLSTSGDAFNTYFDAFGFSWDADYDVGDNNLAYSVEGTPFVHGPNIIVIPTTIFTKTELHEYIEKEELDETPLYSADKDLFELISVERDGNPNKSCGDVDFVFIRYDISPDDALDVLDMLLIGLINETLDENNNTVSTKGVINKYSSTKLDGIDANSLNLPYGALGYIPWFSNYTNSPMGPEPYTSDPLGMFLWWITWLIPILHVIVLVNMAMVAAERTGYTIGFAKSIFMNLLTAIGDLIWLLIRVAILVLAWIIFAIMILFATILVLLFAGVVLLLDLFADVEYTIEINRVETSGDLELVVGFETTLYYVEFFDITIPLITMTFGSGDLSYEYTATILQEESKLKSVPDDIFGYIFDEDPNPKSSSMRKSNAEIPKVSSSDSLSVEKAFVDFFSSFGNGLTLACGFVLAVATAITVFKDDKWKIPFELLSIAIYMLTIVIVAMTFFQDNSLKSRGIKLLGMGLALIISGSIFFAASGVLGGTSKYKANLFKDIGFFPSESKTYAGWLFLQIFSWIDLIIGGALLADEFLKTFSEDLEYDITDEIKNAVISVVFGGIALFLAYVALMLFGGHKSSPFSKSPTDNLCNLNRKDKSRIALLFGVGSVVAGAVLLTLGYIILLNT
jgi:hypothetical protein